MPGKSSLTRWFLTLCIAISFFLPAVPKHPQFLLHPLITTLTISIAQPSVNIWFLLHPEPLYMEMTLFL